MEGVENGLGGDDVDRAAGGAAPIQCTLWAAENLNPIEVVEGRLCKRRIGEEYVVLMHGNAGFGVVTNRGDADAADLEVGTREVALGVADVRRVEDQVFEFGDLVSL